MLIARHCVGCIAAPGLAVASALAQPRGADFPPVAVDYFRGMDGGIALPLAEVRGCNTWLMWTAGNRAFWDYLAGQSFGTFDPLKTIDSRERPHRFALFGLMNEPGFVPATAPDQYGLWIDRPTSADAPYGKGFAKADFLRVYGRAIGIVGLRLLPNPKFDAAARRRWDPIRFRDDGACYGDPNLVRPYTVGMACGFCHVGPNPIAPPIDPERRSWENLSSYIGAQYWHAALNFSFAGRPDNFFYQVLAAMPPCTVDASASLARREHIWDNFSSETYKDLPAVGTIEVNHPFTGAPSPYAMPDGGRGYMRVLSLVSIWASTCYFHDNSLGRYILDLSVLARVAAFQSAIEKLLWPDKCLGMGSVYRTTAESWLVLDRDQLPPLLFAALRTGGATGAQERAVRIGPIRQDTPINLLANTDLELSARNAPRLVKLALALKAALRDVKVRGLGGATARLEGLVLLAVSKCPDFAADRGHLFGARLTDDDKHALIAFLQRL